MASILNSIRAETAILHGLSKHRETPVEIAINDRAAKLHDTIALLEAGVISLPVEVVKAAFVTNTPLTDEQTKLVADVLASAEAAAKALEAEKAKQDQAKAQTPPPPPDNVVPIGG